MGVLAHSSGDEPEVFCEATEMEFEFTPSVRGQAGVCVCVYVCVSGLSSCTVRYDYGLYGTHRTC